MAILSSRVLSNLQSSKEQFAFVWAKKYHFIYSVSLKPLAAAMTIVSSYCIATMGILFVLIIFVDSGENQWRSRIVAGFMCGELQVLCFYERSALP